ncbi:5-dehydro-2-deoxygluconokinase [Megasphaera cerevisiae]|uniref:5-dehydro-2-deoxygluconokinase n=1 Tax=Megasphaera cerevisiae TaxID=39029 RepID=UPI000943CC25|nr:5-dehydro-2-deoxygluconokinase [Megasphaera cerevisiae]OKY54383.1 5-dehydro-2-deoxygluconokinase [Megasphaera cerevisiae]
MNSMMFDHSRKFDIVCSGRIAVDFNPVDLNQPLEDCTTFKKYLGGSPANIAVGMARFGKKVGFIGKVSKDQMGTFVTKFFEKEGIDTTQVCQAGQGEFIGLTYTEILSPTESSILMNRNFAADLSLTTDEVSEDYIKQAKIFLISGTALAASPSREAMLLGLRYAKKNNVKVAFVLDYRGYTWKSKEEVSLYYSFIAENSDILIGSRSEFDLMEATLFNDKNDKKSAQFWLDKGNQIVVITHGKDGSTAYTQNGESFSIKPFPIKSLKGFGGGDGYTSAFLYGLTEGWDIIDCLEFGSASAAMLIASHACSQDMPDTTAVKAFIKKEKEEYGEMIARV